MVSVLPEAYSARSALAVAWAVGSALWLHAVAAVGTRPGARRLAAALPLLAGNIAAPVLLFRTPQEQVTLTIYAFLVGWLGSFKAAAWAAGRGPLAAPAGAPPRTRAQAAALYCLPILPADGGAGSGRHDPAHPDPSSTAAAGGGGASSARAGHGANAPIGQEPPGLLVARWAGKLGLVSFCVFAMRLRLPQPALEALYVGAIYGMLGVIMDGPAGLVLAGLGLRLAPHFDAPWRSHCLADFWGRRWNQAAGRALRATVYDPIAQGRWLAEDESGGGGGGGGSGSGNGNVDGNSNGNGNGKEEGKTTAGGMQLRRRRPARDVPPADGARGGSNAAVRQRRSGAAGRRRRFVGMAAAFAASGLAHEAIFFAARRQFTPQLRWLWFFSLQAPLIWADRRAAAALRARRVRLPPAVHGGAALALLALLAHFLFFQPAEQAGLVAGFAHDMRTALGGGAAAAASLLSLGRL